MAGIDPDGANVTTNETTTYHYDAFGREISVDHDRGTSGIVETTLTTYDGRGRVVSISSPQGIVNCEYDPATGNRTRTWSSWKIAPDTRINDNYYDTLGRPIGVRVVERNNVPIDPNPFDANNLAETTSYLYDLLGNLDFQMASNETTTEYIYDGANRLDKLIHSFANGSPLAEFNYDVRADGRRIAGEECIYESDDGNDTNNDDDGTAIEYNQWAWQYDGLNGLTDEIFIDADNLLTHAVIITRAC